MQNLETILDYKDKFVTLCDLFIFLFLPSSTSEATDGTSRHPPSIQRIRALFGEKVDETSVSPSSNTAAQCHAESVREGWLHCKVTSIEGKVRILENIL